MPVHINSKKQNAGAGGRIPLAAANPLGGTSGELLFGLPQPPPGLVQLPPGVSLCMIVKNEERFLRACLESIAPVVDEICIYDTGSSDGTIAIAEAFGADVQRGEWRDDFSWARNNALAMATRRWIIMLDADEVLRPVSIAPLRALREVPAHTTGVWLRCYSASDDYKGSGHMSNAIVRIFPNTPRVRFRNPIHEFVTVDGSGSGLDARTSPIAIDHYGYTAEILAAREKGKRNLAIAKGAIESSPHDSFNWSNYGLTAYICGDPDTAIMALEKMRDLVGNEARGFVPNSLATLADIYCDQKRDFEKAEYIAKECLKRAPHFANAHFMLGKAYTRMRRYSEARTAYEAAIEDGKHGHLQFTVDDEVSLWKAHSEIGVSYVHEGEYERALEWFDRGLRNRPNAQPLLLNRLKALDNLQRYEEATREYAALWAQYKDDAVAVPYVNFVLRRRQYDEALRLIDEAVEHVTPECAASLLTTAATLCDKLQLVERFESYMRAVLAIEPGNWQALTALEDIYKARNEDEKFEALRRHELQAPCKHPGDFARRSARLLATGDVEKAREAALAGLEKAPDDASLLYNAAAAEIRLGNRAGALGLLVKIGRENAELFKTGTYLRAMLLHEAGRFEEALAASDDLLALESTQFDALLLRAKCLDGLGRVEDAERVLRTLPRADTRVSLELAGILMKLGRFEEASAIAESAVARTS